MKRVISVLILMILLFLVFQFGFTYFKEGHNITYDITSGDKIFDVNEKYIKGNSDIYDILITNGDIKFSYNINNIYNKQKNIITEIEYYEENNTICIYPIITKDKEKIGTYIECYDNGNLYVEDMLPNQNIITNMKNMLIEKGYTVNEEVVDLETTSVVGTSTVYTNNLLDNDTITLWSYKGIEIIKEKDSKAINVLSFDKYENNHGYLVDKYYIVPNYLSYKVLEFSSVTLINVETGDTNTLELNTTLSSDTYINGIVDNKLYYTDPSNLLQVEINPSKKQARLIGNTSVGGQYYNGKWESINIYDFKTNKILFSKEIPEEVKTLYSYEQIIETDTNYYILTTSKEVYRVSKDNLDVRLLILRNNDISNLKVVGDRIYYVIGDNLYYKIEGNKAVTVLKNNELKYNKNNRIDIYNEK